jgi:transcriptional regulator with XRE-family HTH domain/nitrogen fixation protein FixH
VTDRREHRLGDVLREAREAKGVDLLRVERDTKIRERYLSALERGQYRELPGSVYTKGFLRNYGAYLGLDPEYLIDLYRIETTTTVERPRVPTPPRPLAARRSRAFVVTPGALVAAILTIGVGAFVAYLAFEIINFARTPELRITQPPGNVNGYTGDEIVIRGVTAPNARVVVDNLRENPQVTADVDGLFEVVVGLVPGSNVVRLTATDPVTNRQSATEERTILVVTEVGESPSPGAVEARLDEPEDGARVRRRVPISGTATAGAEVLVRVRLVEEAEPSFRVVDAAGAAVALSPRPPREPEPLELAADESGAFEGTLPLVPGTWELEVSAGGGEPIVRTVTVTAGGGLTGTIRVVDGDSYLELEEDGRPVQGVSGSIVSDGDRIGFEADDELRIRAGNAAAVRLTVNGINLGAMGGRGAVVEWRITPRGR